MLHLFWDPPRPDSCSTSRQLVKVQSVTFGSIIKQLGTASLEAGPAGSKSSDNSSISVSLMGNQGGVCFGYAAAPAKAELAGGPLATALLLPHICANHRAQPACGENQQSQPTSGQGWWIWSGSSHQTVLTAVTSAWETRGAKEESGPKGGRMRPAEKPLPWTRVGNSPCSARERRV